MARRLVLGLVVLAVVWGSGAAADARGRPWQPPPPLPPLECGVLPDHDVRLTADLTCTEPFVTTDPQGYVVPWFPSEWDDLRPTIDLGGHTLDITAISIGCERFRVGGGCGLFGPYRFVNGTIRGNLANTAALDHVTVRGVLYPGFTGSGPSTDFTMTNSALVDGVLHANWIATIDDSFFLRSRVDRGPYHEIGVGLTVRRSIFVDSPAAAIDVRDAHELGDVSATIERNLFVRSQGPAVRFSIAEWGFGTWKDNPSTFTGNVVIGGHDDGISIHGYWNHPTVPTLPPNSGPFTIADNLAVANAGHGIAATVGDPVVQSQIVDGGGNRAFGNGVEPQCVGVACGSSWWR